jgi:hypothetical protein
MKSNNYKTDNRVTLLRRPPSSGTPDLSSSKRLYLPTVKNRGTRKNNNLVTHAQVKGMIASASPPETKYSSVIIPSSSITTTGSPFDLTVMTQGVNDTQRVGDTIRMRKFNYSLIMTPSVSTVQYLQMRILIGQWTGALVSGTPPTLANVLYDNTSPGNLTSVWNQDSIDGANLKVLVDRFIIMNAPYEGQAWIRGNVENFKQQIQFTAGTTNGYGKLFMWVISNVSTSTPSISGYCTSFFDDA